MPPAACGLANQNAKSFLDSMNASSSEFREGKTIQTAISSKSQNLYWYGRALAHKAGLTHTCVKASLIYQFFSLHTQLERQLVLKEVLV